MRKETKPPFPKTVSDAAQKAIRQIMALRQLTRQTGTRTTKTQNAILQALPADVLAEVAEILAGLDSGRAL